MASNPMQRKSRNSFLLGMIVTLIITGIVIGILLVMLKQKNDELQAEISAKVKIYTLSEDVKAGQILTEDMFITKSINIESVPSNATATAQVIKSWFLQTKQGESIYTDQYGLYFDRSSGDASPDRIIEVIKNTGEAFQDTDGDKVATGDYYIDIDGVLKKITSNNIQTDEFGMFYVDEQANYDKITRVYQESSTDEFYIYKLNTTTLNTSNTRTRIKEYIEIQNVPVLAKVNMKANTVMTPELIVQSDEIVTDDLRQEEYNMIVLPMDLMTNDYVDIRLMTPSGQNFVVISKVQVEIPENADGTYVADTIKVKLREDEILTMSSAIVEAYGLNGAKLYVTKYVDPAMQEAASPTYTPNTTVTAQIQSNPNIVDLAKEELASRYSDAAKNARNNYLQQSINNTDSQEYLSNIQSGMNEDVGTSITTRKNYLDSLEY